MALLASCSPLEQAPTETSFAAVVEPLLSAWERADLVCLGETHGRRLDGALQRALARHPAFADTVDVVVLESASGVHQELLDRFVLEGAILSREELQPIWRDAGRGAPWELPAVEELLRTIRAVNRELPRDQRVRVLAGAVPIPWGQVQTPEDLVPWLDREAHLAKISKEKVLDRGLRGLAIYGAYHCEKAGSSLAARLERVAPGRVWSVFALAAGEMAAASRERLGIGPEMTLVPVTGHDLADRAAGDAFFEGHLYSEKRFGDLVDAVISYGGAPDAMETIDEDSLPLDFRRELERRDRLRREAQHSSNRSMSAHGPRPELYESRGSS